MHLSQLATRLKKGPRRRCTMLSFMAMPAAVEKLLGVGAGVNDADAAGATPLIMAAQFGYTDIVRMLLAAGATPGMAAVDGYTALYCNYIMQQRAASQRLISL